MKYIKLFWWQLFPRFGFFFWKAINFTINFAEVINLVPGLLTFLISGRRQIFFPDIKKVRSPGNEVAEVIYLKTNQLRRFGSRSCCFVWSSASLPKKTQKKHMLLVLVDDITVLLHVKENSQLLVFTSPGSNQEVERSGWGLLLVHKFFLSPAVTCLAAQGFLFYLAKKFNKIHFIPS